MNTKRALQILKTIDIVELLSTGLQQRYLTPNEGDVEDPFAERRGQRQFERITELPELSIEEASQWGQLSPLGFGDTERVAIDLLAWYQPYSDYGPNDWGIYFDEEKMNGYARDLYRVAKAVRSDISPKLVHSLVWDEVLRHEIEHCVQELTASSLSLLFTPIHKSSLEIYRQDPSSFEALATHFQHTHAAYRTKRDAPGEMNFAKTASAGATKPAGYNNWNRIDVPITESGLYEGNKFSDVHKIANQLRGNLKKPILNPYLDIPKFIG